MRYSLQRYDDVYGTSDITMVVDDVYFNRAENYMIADFSSLEATIDAITAFIGADDFINMNGIHYILNQAPRYSDIREIMERLHFTVGQEVTFDDAAHPITGIIKINDKTTTITDWGKGVNNFPTNSSYDYYGGSNSSGATGSDHGPWNYWVSCSGSTTRASMNFRYNAFSSDAIIDDVISIDENTLYTDILLSIWITYNTITDAPTYHCSVQIGSGYSVFDSVKTILNEYEPPIQDDPNNDPYSGSSSTGGESGTGGGHYSPSQPPSGTYSPTSDPNPVPGMPSISATDTGFITLFNPTSLQLKTLAEYMWGSLFDITTWKKIFADPMDCILGLSIVPVNVPSGGSDTVKVGNISTGITMNKASGQFIELDCGTLSISEYWKSYLDYSPYTKLNVYLPFIGACELNIDDIQINTVGVVYHIDILSGACVAFITAGGNVIAQYSGQCSISIPITSKDFTQTIIALGTLVAGGVATVMSGGLSAPVTASSVGGAVTAMANTAGNVVSSKPTISKSGNMSGSNGLMGVQKPYLFITRPKQCAPKNQNKYSGYPAYITEKVGNLSGFTQFQDIRLEGVVCTEEEKNELLNILRSGVIL